jgi:hypothetical protein
MGDPMERRVPVWALLLCVFFGILFTVSFGWAVMSTLTGNNRLGPIGQLAVSVAAFPMLAQDVFTDVRIDTVDTDEPIRVPRPNVDMSKFAEIGSPAGLELEGLLLRADVQAVRRSPGWRILIGAFTFGGRQQNAALALSPELEVVKAWHLFESDMGERKPRPPHRKFIHGFDVLADGSVIFSFDGGISLQRFDACGAPVWALLGPFHHAVTLEDNEEFVWTLTDTSLVKVAAATGMVAKEITIFDIIEANPTIDILEIRKQDDDDLGGNSRDTEEYWLGDPLHLNDVDPLPEAMAAAYPGFRAGDLLVSSRSLNLVFIVDPESLEVKWWRIGATKRQHDPDWAPTGDISVFDNRMSRDYSRIVRIALDSFRTEVVLDGREFDLYTRIRGKHQFMANGNLLVTSSQEGRVLEVDAAGNMVLEILNTKPGSDDTSYVLSEAMWLPLETYDFTEETVSCAR